MNIEFTEEEKVGTRVMITFLDALPTQENIEELTTYVHEPEMLEVVGREVYVYCPDEK